MENESKGHPGQPSRYLKDSNLSKTDEKDSRAKQVHTIRAQEAERQKISNQNKRGRKLVEVSRGKQVQLEHRTQEARKGSNQNTRKREKMLMRHDDIIAGVQVVRIKTLDPFITDR